MALPDKLGNEVQRDRQRYLPMKIVILLDDFSATGVVNNATAIARELVQAGWEVHLLATRAEGAMRADVPAEAHVTALAGQIAGPRKSRMRRSVSALRSSLRRIRPDVLFSAGNQGHLACMLAAGVVPSCRTIVRISNDPDRPLKEGLASPLKRWLRRRKYRLVAGHADRIGVVSEHLLDSPALASASLARRTVVIPNGVDVDAVRERGREQCHHPWMEDGGEPVVLAVGRLVEQKNFGALVEAVAIARRVRPMRLLIVGEGPEREQLLAQAIRLGIGGDVAISDPVANPVACMARAAAFALPSWREGSSNVLLEAIACGTPVVASRSAGNAAEVLGDGRFGLLFNPSNPTELAQALLQQVGLNAVRPGRRAEDFSRAAALSRYVELITGLRDSARRH
jgi:glycosyltransferase involved in cell wall biosynthesis